MRALFLLISTAILIGCAGAPFRDDGMRPDMSPVDRAGVKKMTSILQEVNRLAPDSAALSFGISGNIRGKKFKAVGNASYQKQPRMMSVTFSDAVFRSVVSRFFLKGDEIGVLFPTDKKLFMESYKSIRLERYCGVDIPFNVFYSLATGCVPLIDGYRVRQGLASSDGLRSMLILENRRYHQSVSFRNDVPDRLLFTDRSSGMSFEFLLSGQQLKNGSAMYRNVRFILRGESVQIDIIMNSIQLNTPVKILTIKDMKLAKDIKIIRI